MKRALAPKSTKRTKTDQPAPRRSRSAKELSAEASLIVASSKKAGPEDEGWQLDIATLRKAAAERALLRSESATDPRQHFVKSLANSYAARKLSVPAPNDLDLKLTEDESWKRDMTTLRKAAAERALLRTGSPKVERKKLPAPIQEVKSLADPQSTVTHTSVQALYDLDPDRAALLLNIALREGSFEERREIGAALAASGVVDEAINSLMKGNREDCYGEFSLLFLVAKAGEVQPLIRLIEKHPNIALRLAVVSLLASSGGPEVLSAFRRLALSGALASEVQLALLEAINQITNPTKETTPSAA